ncbi:WD40/YVTN/BNR-like repeat-containing protein [Amycolatopsis sp. NPDC051903]|uniref:WD40/YVTN/BNR-like repeat-containing protein n=1 Tax=Amycolatopsis sp. NPDC051903 TaxID=3363936 RepID=UPI0037AC7CDC
MHGRSLTAAALAAGLTLALAVPATAAPAHPQAWQLVGPNSAGGHLAFTPDRPARLYVLPDSGRGVYRTDDHGDTWTTQGALGLTGYAIAADPRDGDVVYVAALDQATGTGEVLRSDDAARTFRTVATSPGGLSSVVVSGSGEDVFAAGDDGVLTSTDHGRHWAKLPGSPSGVTDLALDGDELYLTTGAEIHVVDHALSRPNTPRKLAVPGTPYLTSLSAGGGIVVGSGVLGSGVLSTDAGRTFRTLTGPWDAGDAAAFTGLTADGTLEVQTIGSAQPDGSPGTRDVWLSRDRGRTWTDRPAATAAVDLYSEIGAFPDRAREQVVSGPAGIFTTGDSASFKRIGVPDTEVNDLATAGPALLAATRSGTYGSTAPLATHLPRGYQDWGWTGKAPGTFANSVGALAAVSAKTVLRVRQGYCEVDCFTLERSGDGGTTWSPLATVPGNSRSLVVDPRDSGTVYAGSYLTPAVYTSHDGGRTLTQHAIPGLDGVQSLAADPRGTLWIGDVTGLYRSTDGAATARKVFDGEVAHVAVDPRDPRHVVVTGSGFVKVTRDGGATFRTATGLGTADYSDAAFTGDGTLYVSSGTKYEPGQGVLRSTDGGARFTALPTQPLDRDVRTLLPTHDGRWLLAGTGAGVYRLPLR